MEIEPIKNTKGYKHALKEIERLMRAKRNTPQGDRLDVLVTLAPLPRLERFPIK